jgi:hypothetical protein
MGEMFMHNFISPDTFLKIQDEITLRNTIVRLDNIMEVNDKELNNISKDEAMHKVQELYFCMVQICPRLLQFHNIYNTYPTLP